MRKVLDTPRAARTAEQSEGPPDYFRPLASSLDAARARQAQVRRELEEIQIPTAMVMRERAGFERPSTPLRIRGSYMSPGERVYAATPAFLPPLPEGQPAEPARPRLLAGGRGEPPDRPRRPSTGSGSSSSAAAWSRRARTSAPRASRRPIRSCSTGWPPSSSREGWSMKAIQRLIVTSATYRQSSRVDAGADRARSRQPAAGPRAALPAGGREVRDVALAASGLLSPKVGGPSVFPAQPDGVWDNPYSKDNVDDAARARTATGAASTPSGAGPRPIPMLATFDAPQPGGLHGPAACARTRRSRP